MERLTLIRITKNQIFLTPEMSFNLSETSLKGDDLRFKTIQDIYLEVDVLYYNDADNSIEVRVVDYVPKNIEKFKEQIVKSSISFIKFQPLLWEHIEPHLQSYTANKLKRDRIIDGDGSSTFGREHTSTLLGAYERNVVGSRPATPKEPVVETVSESTEIYFEDADFNSGFVAFRYTSKQLHESFNLRIENPFIKKEFNAVKAYFPKAFGGKKQFSVTIAFTLKDKTVTDIATTSLEIEGINEAIIDSIKQERVASLTSTPLRKQVNKSLFTADELFDSFEADLKNGNVFRQSEEDILNVLIRSRNVRNAKQLQYLSGSKQSAKEKLRFTLNPLFGFLFFIEADFNNHFCWELLDSHATYLWSFNKSGADTMLLFKRIEKTINSIIDTGREAYRKDFKNKKIDSDLNFCAIDHDKINSSSEESFAVWRQRLDERLM